MKRIAVCGGIYSSNLGDQAIHACLLHMLKRLDAGVETLSFDLSGRSAPAATPMVIPEHPRQVAPWKSKPVLRTAYLLMNAVRTALRLQRLYSGPWAQALASAQALVIGGGQLLMDDGLNFPIKVAGAAGQAQRRGIPYHFSACGVGRSWSPIARRLFGRALRGSASITLRDHLSAQRLQRFVPGLRAAVTFDPAIWASAVYPAAELPEKPGFIGLGVISCRAYNARTASERFSEAAWMDVWLELMHALQHGSRPLCLFSNGHLDDQQFAHALHARAIERGWRGVELVPRPLQVDHLARTLRACRVVIAARLHATVLSNAFDVTSIGLLWDEKVRAYYDEISRPEQCFAMTYANLPEIARAAHHLYGQPFGQKAIADLRERALDGARAVLSGDGQAAPG